MKEENLTVMVRETEILVIGNTNKLPEAPKTPCIMLQGDNVLKKTLNDFFVSEDEALKNPCTIIPSNSRCIEGCVHCDVALELIMEVHYVEASGKRNLMLIVNSYGDPIFEPITLLKMSGDGTYLIHATYNNMDKFLAFRQK